MNIIVQKYGGTSVESRDKLQNICNRVLEYKDKNYKIVIVVSAQGNDTDKLLNEAYKYSSTPSKRELDMLLSTGEIKTVSLLTMMLNDHGIKSIGLTGEQAGIISTSTYGEAKIKQIYEENILNHLKTNNVVVVAGFQAIDRFGNITTLGRGGSDLTAVAIASAINAEKCEIYSDIDGIFTADPKIIPHAKLLKKISYDEMLEASSAGAKVMHNRSILVGKKYKLPIKVKNASTRFRGSIIKEKSVNSEKKDNIERSKVRLITKRDNTTEISLVGEMIMSNKKVIHTIYTISYKENIQIHMITFSELAIHILVDTDKSERFLKLLHSELIEKA